MTLYVKYTPEKGQGVFTTHPIKRNQKVLTFKGPLVSLLEATQKYSDTHNHYLEVGNDLALGASGEIDDLVNHSCDANCAVKVTTEGIVDLMAVRDIQIGEEITFDYSITSTELNIINDCQCQASSCRGTIGGYPSLPVSVKVPYLIRGFVPKYVLDRFT